MVCNSASEIEGMVERVRYLDTHDDAYLEMLMQSPFYDNDWCVKRYEELEKWLVMIVSQDREAAYRRAMDGMAVGYQETLKSIAYGKNKSLWTTILDKAYSLKKSLCRKVAGQKIN